MILRIILFILIILIFALMIMFLFCKLFPSIQKLVKDENESLKEDCVISNYERDYIKPEYEPYEKTHLKALVLCSCTKSFKSKKEYFNSSLSCFLMNAEKGTGTDCKYSCIGLGDCSKVCPQRAIKIVNMTAVVTSNCIGCGKCISVCPKNIITLLPETTSTYSLCSNKLNDLTSCSDNQNEKNVEWKTKKDFKIWSYCYKLFKPIIKKQ
ncbi:MAG: 4Fe-4S binding protein [Treponema sp.]|nr:4Fe-4S binding protein [Treponema sp.]